MDFALRNDGDGARGRLLFADEQRLACSKCHSLDGTGSKAGPDLSFVGDKLPRRELIRAILEPSAAIAVGYGTTVVETKLDEQIQGIINALRLIVREGLGKPELEPAQVDRFELRRLDWPPRCSF